MSRFNVKKSVAAIAIATITLVVGFAGWSAPASAGIGSCARAAARFERLLPNRAVLREVGQVSWDVVSAGAGQANNFSNFTVDIDELDQFESDDLLLFDHLVIEDDGERCNFFNADTLRWEYCEEDRLVSPETTELFLKLYRGQPLLHDFDIIEVEDDPSFLERLWSWVNPFG